MAFKSLIEKASILNKQIRRGKIEVYIFSDAEMQISKKYVSKFLRIYKNGFKINNRDRRKNKMILCRFKYREDTWLINCALFN